jgi:hypothetical protein
MYNNNIYGGEIERMVEDKRESWAVTLVGQARPTVQQQPKCNELACDRSMI